MNATLIPGRVHPSHQGSSTLDPKLVDELLSLTVDEWCARPDKPTIVLETPHGEVLFVADRDAYTRAVEAGKVVLSPLEVEQLALTRCDDVAGSDFARALIQTKRAFPGARVEDLRIGRACRPESLAEQICDIARNSVRR